MDYLQKFTLERAQEGSKLQERIDNLRRNFDQGRAQAGLEVCQEIENGLKNGYSESHILFNLASLGAAIAEVYSGAYTDENKNNTDSKPNSQEESAKNLFTSE